MFYGADGQPWFRLDEQRHDVSLDEISVDLQHAVVAVEDRRFYYHPGIDPIGLARAVVRDLRGGRREGGSTLTQQLARTIFLSNVKTFGRKIKEGGIALLIEAQLSKNQILEFYLNRIYLSAGVYGVETMSEHLFRKPARAVTLECGHHENADAAEIGYRAILLAMVHLDMLDMESPGALRLDRESSPAWP
jgi:penicillin-binding protein 1A